jgi:hypothetical protein
VRILLQDDFFTPEPYSRDDRATDRTHLVDD